MSDFYLKFVDEEQAQEVLYTKVVDEWSGLKTLTLSLYLCGGIMCLITLTLTRLALSTSHRLTHCQSHHLSLCLTLAGL